MPVFLVPLLLTRSSETRVAEPERSPLTLTPIKTMTNIFTRSNILNALLALCTAIEYCYDMGDRFGTWWRQGGREEVIRAVALVITAIVWTITTARLGAQVIRTNAPTWISQANTTRHRISRAFSYEYQAS
jgi:hypothetical protein